MIPHQILTRLSHRYGVSEDFATRFLPLVQRAERAAPDVRQRILKLIERTFQRQAEKSARDADREVQADTAVLHSVARLLHGWEPAAWLKTWSKDLQGFVQESLYDLGEQDPGDAPG
jgi:hypothetical protein